MSFEAAEQYALKWLGEWAPELGELKVNSPYDYSGYGDMIEIREENE